MTGKAERFWIALSILLAIVILTGGFAAVRFFSRSSESIEIYRTELPEITGHIHVNGAVASPGIYPVFEGDELGEILRAAGGLSDRADLSALSIFVPGNVDTTCSQKIDINRADTWLLTALPGIGETLAGRIVTYREQKGPFRNTRELQMVEGIGDVIFKKIENLITVSDRN